MTSLQSIENSLCRAQKEYQSNSDKIGRGLLALISLTYHVASPNDDTKKHLRNIRKLASKLMHQLEAVKYHTD